MQWVPSVEWAALPGNVIDNVLVYVPMAQTATLRLLCRHWRGHVDQSIRTLVTNGKYPYMMPVSKISQRFPMISNLDLSCQAWGYGQSLTPASCDQLSSLEKLHHLRSVKMANWSTLTLRGFKAMIGLKRLVELDVTNCVSITDNYLRCFRSVQSNLKILVLNGCERITDNGLTHLSILRHLTELRLARVLGIAGETLWQLSPSLECLDVSFCENLTDGSIKSMIQCSSFCLSLSTLNLSGCPNVKSTTLASLSTLSHMTRLKLSYLGQLTEMERWSRFTELQVLDVSYASGLNMQEALPVIAQMTQLRSLRMNGCRRTQGLQSERLAGLKHLKCLEISQWSNIQFGLDAADVLPNLEVLNLAECYGPINNTKQYFKNCPRLRILGLSKIAYLPQNVLSGVGRLRSLEVLNLSGLGNMSNRTIQEVAKATSLKYLDLSQSGMFCKVTNTGAHYLQSLKSLRSLKISGWTEVTSNGFSFLRGLLHLTSLDVSSCTKISNKVLRVIADAMPELTELNLVNCFHVECSGLGVLRKMSELESLKLSLHIKGDVDSQLPNLRNLQLVSPLDAACEDRHHPTNFQHVIEDYSREEDSIISDATSFQNRI